VLDAAIVLLLAGSPAVRAAEREPVFRQLPREPLLALTIPVEELSQKLEAAAEWFAGTATAPFDANGIAPLRGVLATAGPDVAIAVDLPALDAIAVALRVAGPAEWPALLTRVGLIADLPDAERFEGALRALAPPLALGGPDEQGIVLVRIPLPAGRGAQGEAPPTLDMHYAIRQGRLAASVSREWVGAAHGDTPAGERLAGGADFASVFAHLDERPRSLVYVNLPKLRTWVAESAIVAAVLDSGPEARRFLAPLLDPEVMSIGLGSTSVAAGAGVRTTNFGPTWMSGTASSSSLLAALAVPALLVATERGRARDTLETVRSIAAACEGFSTDARAYPGPTRGWVPIGEVAPYLEPIYIASLPRTDAWQNPILYWSNGKSYRVLSTGPDGRMDLDWSGVSEPRPSSADIGDIVIADGRILAGEVPQAEP
jgi:hypothetical protein